MMARNTFSDDTKPEWSAGEHLTGDDYVKWIRKLRLTAEEE